MKRYLRPQIERFLSAVDDALTHSATLVIIGGSAAVLHYGVTQATHDIDTVNTIDAALEKAAAEARKVTGLAIPIRKSGVFDGPHEYESRLERILPHLTRLSVCVPEKHDLALMKMLRGEAHDLDAIAEIHSKAPFDFKTLVERFTQEMGAAIGNPVTIRGHFLAMMERLFPDQIEEAARLVPPNYP